MILSLKGQSMLFLSTIMLGMASGLFYDCFRTIRSIFKHPSVLVYLEDILYWLVAVLTMFLYMLEVNDGEIRPFLLFGVFLGMVFYFLLPSKGIMAVSHIVVNMFKFILNLFFEILITPFRLLNIVFGEFIRKIARKVKKNLRKLLHLVKIYVNIKLRCLKDFLRVVLKKI